MTDVKPNTFKTYSDPCVYSGIEHNLITPSFYSQSTAAAS